MRKAVPALGGGAEAIVPVTHCDWFAESSISFQLHIPFPSVIRFQQSIRSTRLRLLVSIAEFATIIPNES